MFHTKVQVNAAQATWFLCKMHLDNPETKLKNRCSGEAHVTREKYSGEFIFTEAAEWMWT